MSFLKELAIALPIIAIVAILSSQLVAVPTESMTPIINAGDVVLVEKTDVLGVFSELNPDDIKVGDIIVYEKTQKERNQSEFNESIIHRVIAVKESHGVKYLILKGDNNHVPDDEAVSPTQVMGRAIIWGENPVLIPKVGNLIIFVKSLIPK